MAQQSSHSDAGRGRLASLTTPSGLFVSAVLLLVALSVTSTIHDPDFWWHLRSGQLMLSAKALLSTDPFTYTAASHHWTMHEWLTEVSFALMYRAGGLALIVLVLSAVTWLGFLCIALRARLRRPGLFVLGLGIALATVTGSPIWGPRAQMITFALSCLLLLMVERHLQRGGRAIWALVPLFTLWSNLHSGFVIGLGFLAVVIVAELIGARLRAPGGADLSRVRTLAFVLLAGTVASLVNPNGPGILLYALQTQSSPAQQSLIAEWQSPNFHLWEMRAFELMLLSTAVMIAVNRRMRARDVALVAVTTVLALQSVRHIALFVAAVTPVWIDQAQMITQRLHRRARAERQLPPLRLRVITYAAVIGAIGALYVGDKLVPAMTTTEASAAYATDFPVCAVRWLREFRTPLRIFNQYGEGGYLAYELSARGDKVFVFGDAALMGDRLLYDYGQVETVQPSWDAIIRDANTDLVLFDRSTPLSDVMEHSSDWVRVYQDAHNVAFVAAQRYARLSPPAAPAAYRAGDACAPKNAPSHVAAVRGDGS